jgi:lipoprotein signal peptidase
MGEPSYRMLLWTLVLFGTTVDQVTKYTVFRWLYRGGEGGEYVIVPGAFKLLAQFTGQQEADPAPLSALRTWGGPVLPKVNHGALFGLGTEYVAAANALFALISIAAAVAIAYWSTRRTTARDLALCASLGLILAGTLGNLYDRLVFGGVRDFLYFHYIEWPVFNVADCCLVFGAGLLLTQAFLTRPVPAPQETATVALSASDAK